MFLFESSEQKRLRTDMEKQMETCLSNTQKYPEAMDAIAKNINNQKVIQMIVDNVKSTIKDSDYQPIRKFQSIKLLRDLMKTQSKNLGKYVVKKILKRLAILAEHRADSGDEERGRDIFGKVKKDQEQYAIKFLNELLRALQQWGKNWPKGSEGTHQQFHKAYKDLVINGVRFPKEQPKLNQATFRNSREQSLNKYSSVPVAVGNRGSRKIQETPPKPPVVQRKIAPKVSIQSKPSINIGKTNEYFQQVKDNLVFLKETLGQADQEMWPTIKDIIEQLSQNISLGNQIVAQITQKNQNQDDTIDKIQQCFDFSQSILKDMRKADRNPSQFTAFKNKYTKMTNKLLDSLAKRSKNQKIISQNKPEIKFQKKQIINSQIKKISTPIVNAANQYNSRSGKDGWIVKQKQQFNSNSHKSENEQQANPDKFGSFGIGGIGGQKYKKQSSSDQKKKNSQNQVKVESENGSKVATERKVVQKKIGDQNKKIKTETVIQQKFQKQISQRVNKQQRDSQFGGFQLSGDKDKPKQEQYFDEPAKSNHEKTKNMFNDSDFKQKSVDDDKSKDSGDFFQQIQKNNQETGNRLPTSKRVKTINQGKNEIIGNTQNPFALQMNSQIQSQGLSAFNKDKSSLSMNKSNPFEAQNKSNIVNSVSKIPQRKNSALSVSVQGNPFQTSNLKNPWDQSFQKKTDNPFEDKKSVTSKESKKSIVNNFDFNKSFTKTQRSNPFETSTQEGKKKVQIMSNPFSSDNNNNCQIGGERSNPFQTTVNQEFNPPQNKKLFDSVSQQNSFKKIDIGSIKVVQIQNPFEINKNLNQICDSWKIQPKQYSQNQSEVNFDAFEDIPKKMSNELQNKNSINSMRNRQNFGKDEMFNQFGRHSKQSDDRSVNFSKFGQPEEQNLSNIFKKKSFKEGDDKSINFQDFQHFPKKIDQVQPSNRQNGFRNQFSEFDITKNSKDLEQKQQQASKSGFSGFNPSQQRQKKSQNSNNSGVDFNAFENFDKKPQILKDRRQLFDMKSQRSQQENFDFKLSLRSNNQSQYPKFNEPSKNKPSQFGKNYQNNMNLSQTNRKNQQSLSIKLEDFSPVGKKGNLWDPLQIQGIKNSSRVYNVNDYDISEKTKKMLELKRIYQEEMKQFKQIKIRQLQTRKSYQEKYNRINDMISQANSYKSMLQKLKETNHIKQNQIDGLNEKIKVAHGLKQKILQKEKQLFQLMKNQNAKQQKKEVNTRSNAAKWQIFNRNLQQMRNCEQNKFHNSFNNNISRFA